MQPSKVRTVYLKIRQSVKRMIHLMFGMILQPLPVHKILRRILRHKVVISFSHPGSFNQTGSEEVNNMEAEGPAINSGCQPKGVLGVLWSWAGGRVGKKRRKAWAMAPLCLICLIWLEWNWHTMADLNNGGNVGQAAKDGEILNSTAEAKDGDVERVLSQMPDLSFMLEKDLSVPSNKMI
ncbi:unnamed protein product [Camellia sinensis]